jgi:glycosyltransferase involved in cell wall biosynthesis
MRKGSEFSFAEALVDAIRKLAGDEGLRRSLGQHAREEICRRYSEEGIRERGRSVLGEVG